MEATSTLQDLSQALKNVGGQEGVELKVSLDRKTMNHFTLLIFLGVGLGVGLVQLLKN